MTRQHIKIAVFVFCTSLLFAGCEKNELTVSPFDYADGQALFKLNYSCPYAANPGVRIKINDKIVSSNITFSTPFPGGGLNTGGSTNADYLQLNPGANTVKLSLIEKATGEDSVVLYETSVDLKAATYQTLHVTDTAANTQSVLVTDPGNIEDSGYAQYRFINLIPNSTGLDLYFGTRKLAMNVAYKQITDTFRIAAGATGAWTIRVAGSATALPNPYTNTGTTSNQRVFTVYARGYLNTVSTTEVRAPRVSLMYNK